MIATIVLLNAAGTATLTGQATHLSWATYRRISDGASASGPAFTESATVPGEYKFNQDPGYAGIINATATTSPASAPYMFVPGGYGNVFAVFDLTGTPVAGLTLTGTFANIANDAPATVSVTGLGGGLYVAVPADPTITAFGTIDTGAGHTPRFVTLQVQASAVGPSLALVSPPQSTVISPGTPLSFSVTQGTATITTGTCVVSYPNGDTENVFLPGTLTFAPDFSDSPPISFAMTTVITVIRNDGWPASPTLTETVTDAAGLSATATWAWVLTPARPPASSSSSLTPAQQAPSGYGSDMRTYVIQDDGTRDWDPFMLIIDDPAVVLGEMILRRLSIPRSGGRSALFYDNNAGFDLHQFLNASLSSDQRAFIQTGIVQEIEKDDRIESVVAVVDSIPAAAMMVVTINAVASKGGVFRFVVAIDSVTTKLLNYQQVAA